MKRKLPESIREELAALAARPESEIDFSDIPATTEEDWHKAERGKFYRPLKHKLTLQIDADVLAWLKGQDKDYKSYLTNILRSVMLNPANMSR